MKHDADDNRTTACRRRAHELAILLRCMEDPQKRDKVRMDVLRIIEDDRV